jgi:hypothetical protein
MTVMLYNKLTQDTLTPCVEHFFSLEFFDGSKLTENEKDERAAFGRVLEAKGLPDCRC